MATQPLRVKINGDASGLNAALDKASGKLKSFGSKLTSAGKSLSMLSAPLILAGGAGVKMALDFDKSMTKIKSLVGIAGAEVDDMGVKVKEMAAATGVSSAEAADAMFFITSAGLRGKDAMEALEIATKAAAAGLGETKTIADLASSAMNAYGSETLSATDATDVLTAAVREGKLESSELAGAMGGVIPIASNMGVEFHEVGAAMAAMSRTGTNAAVGATQLTAILASLKKPTAEAEQALTKMGLSTAGVQKSLAEKGLMATLEMLSNTTKEFGVDITSIFPNIRALKGVMDLTGAGMEDAKGIFDSLADSAGSTAKAFDETSESLSFKFDKATNQTKQSLEELGNVLLVAVIPVVEFFGKLAEKLTTFFKNLSEPMQKIIGGLALLAAGIGPLLIVIGTLISSLGSIATALKTARIAFAAFTLVMKANPIIAVASAIVGLATALSALGKAKKEARLKELTDEYKDLSEQEVSDELNQINQELGKQQIILAGMKNQQGYKARQLRKEIKLNEEKSKFLQDQLTKIQDSKTAQDDLNLSIEKTNTLLKEQTTTKTEAQPARPKVSAVSSLTPEGIVTVEPEQGSMITRLVGTQEEEEAANARMSRFMEAMNNLGLSVDSIMSAIGDSLMGAFTALLDGENFVKVLGNALKQIIKQLIAAAMAALALSTILGGLGIGSFQGGGTGFKDIFGKLSGFGKFANGGIVSAPTMGLMGEYPGAKSNPEVIAPLDKLKNMIGNTGGAQQVQVGGSFEIRGQDLVVALERANSTRNRLI